MTQQDLFDRLADYLRATVNIAKPSTLAVYVEREGEALLRLVDGPFLPGKCVLQDWVLRLGLRHQGTLLTAVRGCDDAPKDDPSKKFVRCFRAAILNAHCGDPRKAATFIEACPPAEIEARFQEFRRSTDHYPHHYVMHLLHCCEIVGFKHPNPSTRQMWHSFYGRMCRALHLNPESEAQLDARLDADEQTFAARDADWCCDGAVNALVSALDGVPSDQPPRATNL